jgi:hypothetical protein
MYSSSNFYYNLLIMEFAVNNPKAVAAIYVAVFGRAPDGRGLEYWLNTAKTYKLNFAQLTDAMIDAASNIPGFQDIKDPFVLVSNLYQNVLGKTYQDDPDGINYWVEKIKVYRYDPGYVVEQILETAVEKYPDHPATKTFLNRVEAAIETAERFYDPIDINHDGQISKEDLQFFYDVISQVNEDPTSLEVVLDLLKDKPIVIDFTKYLDANSSNNLLPEKVINIEDFDIGDAFSLKDGTYYAFISQDGDLLLTTNPIDNAIGTVTIQHTNEGVFSKIDLNLQGRDNLNYIREEILIPNNNTVYIQDADISGNDEEYGRIDLNDLKGIYTKYNNNFKLDLDGVVKVYKYNMELPIKVHISGTEICLNENDCTYQLSPDSYAILETPDHNQVNILPQLSELVNEDILLL